MNDEETATDSVLVLGYGNPGRQDDGLGPAFANAFELLGRPDVAVDSNYQLNVEDAAAAARHGRVLFVDALRRDASGEGDAPFVVKEVQPAREIAFTSHSVSPEAIVALCDECFGTRPEAWTLGIRGYEFHFAEGLTTRARENLEQALEFAGEFIGPRPTSPYLRKEREHGKRKHA